jgi:hypothetical protein
MLHAIDKKRLALLTLKAEQLAARAHRDPALELQLSEVTARVRAYEDARRGPSEMEMAATAREEMKKAGIVRLGIKRDDGRIEALN